MKPKIIQTIEEYENALAHIETLWGAPEGSSQEQELELFSFLVENYEKKHYPIPFPDPISAIVFRMEQQGLTRKDMKKYLGSQSKVSEILNGKRPLSLSMIRKLNQELDIPAEVLLQEKGKVLDSPGVSWQNLPFKEMVVNGFFSDFTGSIQEAKEYSEELINQLFSVFNSNLPTPIYCKHSHEKINDLALLAWQARVLALIQNDDLIDFNPDTLNNDFISNLVHLSFFDQGPKLVKEYLNKKGIHFAILPHLEKTYLDGAAFLTVSGQPVIALTLRFDRLDNFWFTLLHELGHIALHLKDSDIAFFDETEFEGETQDSPQEQEANQFAREALIPFDYWQTNLNPNLTYLTKHELTFHASQLEISSAIIAGRVRWELKNYRKFTDVIGRNQVREQFEEYRVNDF